MTRNNNSKNHNLKSFLALLLMLVLSLTLAFATACSTSDEQEEVKDPTYSYSEVDDGLIKNGTFSYGTIETKLTAFPKTSVTGWSKSNSSDITSASKSGAIDISEKGWAQLLKNLHSDSGTLNFIKEEYNFNDSDVKDAIRNEKGDPNYSPTSDEIKEYVIENYYSDFFTNPGQYKTDLTDSKVYMMNNYASIKFYGMGSSQKITSTTSLILDKGSVAKVSVWVKTANLASQNPTDYGAFVMLDNNFSSVDKAPLIFNNIRNTEWTEYSFVVKADEFNDCQITLILGLGYDDETETQGTAYFDGVSVEYLTNDSAFDSTNAKTMSFDANNEVFVDSATQNTIYYDMSLSSFLDNNYSNYYNDLDSSNVAGELTTFKSGYSQPNGANGSINSNNGVITANLEKASYTVTISSDDFKLSGESYAHLEFLIKNDLSKFYATGITINLVDKFGTKVETREAIATVPEVYGEWIRLGFVIKNNFDEVDLRTFSLQLIIGPSEAISGAIATDFATGQVSIKDLKFSTGSTVKPDESASDLTKLNYNLYELVSASANAVSALYAGETSDSNQSEESTTNYSFTYAPSDIGVITSKPAIVSGYTGIYNDHYYLDENSNKHEVDNNASAGLINSNYIANYSSTNLPNVNNALNFVHTEEEQSIQPIVIYNPNSSEQGKESFGYIGNMQTLSASSSVKITATIRTFGGATAYIYIVNTDGKVKEVMTFNDFTDVDGNEFNGSAKKFQLKVDSSMLDDNGWAEVNFYIATGVNSKNYRIEVWNGSRDGQVKSEGYVFVKGIDVKTASNAFTEPTDIASAFVEGDNNPLYNEYIKDSDVAKNAVKHLRKLTIKELQFNALYPDEKISYDTKYVWTNSDSMIYAIYNTIEPVEKDPFADIEQPDEEDASGCAAQTDPATFWMSFSSIALAIVLVLAIVALVLKRILIKKKANASDAKSHYTVTSRTKTAERIRNIKKSKEVIKEVEDEDEDDSIQDVDEVEEVLEEQIDEQVEQTTQVEESDEEKPTLDEYVYGEVQDFGQDNLQTNFDDENSDKE